MTPTTTLARLLAAALVSSVAATAAHAADAAPQVAQVQQPAAANTDDALITSRVKAALMEDKLAASTQVSVNTSGGVVVLSGTAPNPDTADHLVRLTATVPGVKDVKSELKLGS